MAHVFKISSFGLKLIKAYEGFRPVETTLVSGQRVIGYGHRYLDTEEPAISRKRAEELLKADLEAYEDLVNQNVYAPLSQSQFDALVSLCFNIGPQAFLSSSVLHALNNGRPLAAAAGFDEWRKSVIEGKTYVVDALVRRRTAEKSLFLRATEGVVTAPRNELPPQQDHGLQGLQADDENVFDKQDAQNAGQNIGIVEQTPYAAKTASQPIQQATPQTIPSRRREDGPAGLMGLSETDMNTAKPETDEGPAQHYSYDPHTGDLKGEDAILDLVADIEPDQKPFKEIGEKNLSPIALAAEEVSARLDRLIADTPDVMDKANARTAHNNTANDKSNEQSLVDAQNVSTAKGRNDHNGYAQNEQSAGIAEVIANIKAANDGTHEDYRRPNNSDVAHTRSPDAFIQKRETVAADTPKRDGLLAFWIVFTIGLCMMLYAASRWFMAPKNISAPVSEMSAFITPVTALVGALLVLGTLYYLIKNFVRDA